VEVTFVIYYCYYYDSLFLLEREKNNFNVFLGYQNLLLFLLLLLLKNFF